ncbi:hypothetical protein EYC84_001062 [Monilinia fructicola]|uniref:Protein kinase domain-containing protein n=1 Tax=Monilinia fructicola TaxID=38448 RepID=A0A5M9JR70_MONFR|nr:hypothetical protein EYC84_001062 [Monilinia fructicola]
MPELQCDLSDNGQAESTYHYLNGSLFPIKGLPYDINEKYRIIEKLGFGGFSTVWLAIGIHKENLGRWFAIKILKSNKSNQDDENKLKNDLRKLEEKSHSIVPCLDTFRIKSCYDTDNQHFCLVMKVSGPSLRAYVVTEKPPIDKRRLLAINSTKLLMEMHQNGIVLDDLSSSNFLLRICSLRGFSETQLREKIGEFDDKLQLDLIDIVGHTTFKAFTTAYAAPEVLEGASSTIESNVWGLGCLICEIMTLGWVPFEEQHYVARNQDAYFGMDDEGKLKHLLQIYGDGGDYLDAEQASSLAKFLQKIFVMDPPLRPTTKMILECLKDPKFLASES